MVVVAVGAGVVHVSGVTGPGGDSSPLALAAVAPFAAAPAHARQRVERPVTFLDGFRFVEAQLKDGGVAFALALEDAALVGLGESSVLIDAEGAVQVDVGGVDLLEAGSVIHSVVLGELVLHLLRICQRRSGRRLAQVEEKEGRSSQEAEEVEERNLHGEIRGFKCTATTEREQQREEWT